MSQKARIAGCGIASFAADQMAAGTVSNTLSATGSSSQANSYAIDRDVSVFTTAASNSGARLPLGSTAGDTFYIGNLDSNTMLIYPPVGGQLNNNTVNTSVSVTTKKAAMCISIDGTNYLTIVSA